MVAIRDGVALGSVTNGAHAVEKMKKDKKKL